MQAFKFKVLQYQVIAVHVDKASIAMKRKSYGVLWDE
jgi:hypothetical protein